MSGLYESGLYESLFRRVLFPVYESGLRGRKTLAYLRDYEHSQWLAPEQIERLQWFKLQRLIAHCWQQVPYYRKRWQSLGIDGPEDIRNAADYARLPVLTKSDIRAHFDALIAPGHRNGLLYKNTGGSTGEPLHFGYSRESYERRMAVMWRGYGWAGARLGQRTLYLWGLPIGKQRGKDRFYHRAFNRRMLNAFEMSEARMAAYADAFQRFRPETVVSYVAPIVRLAEWLLAEGRRLPAPQRILTAAETLHRPQRERIEQAFGCPAYNTYGCREFMLIASECEHRDGLHLTADHLKLELGQGLGGVDDDDSPRDIIVTDLHNYGMPMVRYLNGDLATAMRGDACACGRGLPRLQRVDGRRLDAIRTRDGRFLPGEYFPYLLHDIASIRRFQVHQHSLDRIRVLIVPSPAFDDSVQEYVKQELAKVLGAGTVVEIELIDEIPLTPSGKHRVSISDLP